MKKLYSFIGSILGVVIILMFALKNASLLFEFSFEGMDDILLYFNLVQQYLIYALAAIVSLELLAGKKLFSLIFIIILVFVIGTTFFPDVVNSYIPS